MTKKINPESLTEKTELQLLKKVFTERIKNLAEKCGQTKTDIPALSVYRYENPTEPENHIQEPGICLIAQGAKRIILVNEVYRNDTEHYLLTLLDIPVATEIAEASEDIPYLALSLKLDLQVISEILLDINMPVSQNTQQKEAIAATGITLQLFKAFNKLLDLLDEPENIPMLAPLVQREILYRLLISDQGHLLRQITLSGSQSNRIVQTIEWLKTNYASKLRSEELAATSRMSKSTFHHHFRELTSMTPLQYQKWLRLQEARRLMLTEKMDAANAAFKVGYESPSQFSREYSRMFNAPPSRDIKQLRESLVLPR